MSPLPISGIELSRAHLSMYDQSASFVYLSVPSNASRRHSVRRAVRIEPLLPQPLQGQTRRTAAKAQHKQKPQPCQICLRGRCHARRWNMHCYDTKQRDSALTSDERTNPKRGRSVRRTTE